MRKWIVLMLILSLSIMVFSGCKANDVSKSENTETETAAAETEDIEKVFTVGIAKEPANLNPVYVPGIYGEALLGNIFDTLVSFKENPSVATPALATKWDISEDGKEYTFYLRDDVTFHNGVQMKASDVKFTLEEIMNPDNASPSKEFFDPIKEVVIVDDYTIRILLKDPYAPFLLAIGSPTAGIMPEEHVKEVGHDAFDRHPIGTGAFKFVEWLPDDHIKLVKNEKYFLGESNIDVLVFRPIPKPEVMMSELQAGGIDLASDLTPQDVSKLEGNSDFNVMKVSGLSNTYVGFAYDEAPFSDVRFRKAIYHAIPFEDAVAGIWKNVGNRSYSWIPSGVFPDDEEYMKSKALEYDVEKAEKLFNELKADNVITDNFEFSIYTSQDAYNGKIATAIVTELKKFGINAKVEALEWGTLFPILKDGPGMYILGWGSVPDPDRWTYKIFHSTSSMNFSKYSLPEIDAALEKGRTLVSVEDRSQQYIKVMRKALGEDYIHIPLVFAEISVATSSNVTDFVPSPQGYYHLVTESRNVDIKK